LNVHRAFDSPLSESPAHSFNRRHVRNNNFNSFGSLVAMFCQPIEPEFHPEREAILIVAEDAAVARWRGI